MHITKRDGSRETVDFQKIYTRLQALTQIEPTLTSIDINRVTQRVVGGVVDGISTRQLDSLAAETAAGYATEDLGYDALAARLTVSDLHKRTSPQFQETVERLHSNTSTSALGAQVAAPLVTDELLECACKFGGHVDAHTDHERDYRAYTYFGIKTLLQGYLLLLGGEAAERPSHMLWRVAFGIHGMDWDRALETYNAMAMGAMTHASPTLFYAGTPCGSLASCFMTCVWDDSIEGLYDAVKDTAVISKAGGGIGVSVSRVRANGALVRSTGRAASGIMPVLRVLNETARHVTQAGRRKGAVAVYMEPHHADVFALIDIRKNHGVESERARDIFPAMWVSDLFMRRVETDADWTLFSPDTAPGLDEVFGQEYSDLYTRYEEQGVGMRVVRARDLWSAILVSQTETGTPYLMFKDTINRSNAQANVGIIRGSNLCAEICLYTDNKHTAVCNLASIALPAFVDEKAYMFDFERLETVVAMTVRNLDAVIDKSHNPTPEAAVSNAHNRPIGIGVQGLADVSMRMPFDSQEARALNTDIFETIYHAAIGESCRLAEKLGTYPSYEGSPASYGYLQPDLWLEGGYGTEESRAALGARVSSSKWMQLRQQVADHGLRHSVVTAMMPTASTAQILGNTEAFEPVGSNLYVRRTLAGEFTVMNKRLVDDLRRSGQWHDGTRHAIMRADGSVQTLQIPEDLKKLYRTVWEIPQRSICEMAADRMPFVDQSQSLNVFMANPTPQKLSSLHFFNHRMGNKTSSYYVRSRAAVSAVKVTVPVLACDTEGECTMCSA